MPQLPTREGFAVWRDEARLRVERALSQPIADGFLRLYHDKHLHPKSFIKGTDSDIERASWMGVPTWKLPSDMWVYQEIIQETQPDLLIETGAQYGGSALFYASLFDILGQGEVITIDVDTTVIHDSVRAHPRITVIESSSSDSAIFETVKKSAAGKRTMVALDSDHTQHHVAAELQMWPDLVSRDCYLVVEDTALGTRYLPGWGGSLAALEAWLPAHPEFHVDPRREKFLTSLNPGGYLLRIA